MRTAILAAVIGLVASLLGSRPARSDDPADGVSLIRAGMKNWSRSGGGKSPWSLSTAGTLVCEPVADRYVYEDLLGDGTLHVEWRFKPTLDPKQAVHASVTVRGTLGGEQCKIALGAGCGAISASALSSSDRVKTSEVRATVAKPKPADEWNEMDIKLAGKSVAVSLTGAPVSSLGNGPAGAGIFSLNAEGDAVEFRNVRWKAAR